MKKLFLIALGILLPALLSPATLQAQMEPPAPPSYHQAIIVDKKQEKSEITVYQIKFLSGPYSQQTQTIQQLPTGEVETSFEVGDTVVISQFPGVDNQPEFAITDHYRLSALGWLGIIYAAAIILLSRFKGVRSLIGLGLSFAVVVFFIIPQILAGHPPLLISISGSLIIVAATLYLTHGFSKQSTVSLIGTLISLIITGGLALLVTHLAKLTGLGSEEAGFLQYSASQITSMRGLLLSGIIVGALGVIDDITVTQAAIVFQLRQANPKFKITDLYQRALSVGKDHIASMTNTLVLAYAGASLPLFLLFFQNQIVPPWVALNSEIVAEEIVATLVGSLGLVASVPITTLLAAHVASRLKPSDIHTTHTH